jgi:magnesium chelatase subunit D|tara:strand:- start:6243 stop:7919 length:1677 start_codon:yes stop_codon:yes gene_type:complete
MPEVYMNSAELAETALNLCSMAPHTFGGIVFKNASEAHISHLRGLFRSEAIPPTILQPFYTLTDLMGGVDAVSSMSSGKLVKQPGLLEKSGWFIQVMGEKLPLENQAVISKQIDEKKMGPILIFDESRQDDPNVLQKISDRLAFEIDLINVRHCDFKPARPSPFDIDNHKSNITRDQQEALALAAVKLGVYSIRPVIMAQNAAKSLASLSGRDLVSSSDLELASTLVLSHRAIVIQSDEPDKTDNSLDENKSNEKDEGDELNSEQTQLLKDMIIEAVKANLPDDLINQMRISKKELAKTSKTGFGTKIRAKVRGRPKPAINGRPNGQDRIEILATLRQAAPWQKMRRRQQPDRKGLIILPGDLQIQQFENRSERVIVFVVDASGSAAVARLAEAKGAVELMLANAYSKRDFVALIGFRDQFAQVLLEPTRSLVQAKKNLSSFAAGGGTPLASGLDKALKLAERSRQSSKTPIIAILTDGKANIDLNGNPGRDAAMDDAEKVAKIARETKISSIFIDVGRKSNPKLFDLAQIMDAQYVNLPRANAKDLSQSLTNSLDNA